MDSDKYLKVKSFINKYAKLIGSIIIAICILIFMIIKYLSGGKNDMKVDYDKIFVEEESSDSLSQNSNSDVQVLNKSDTPSNNKYIVVEIKGEVNKPNIYWLSSDSIIDDLIKEAGGLTDIADASAINRAELLKNHQSIVIPSINDSIDAAKTTNKSAESDLININTANLSELDSLPGIGASKAEAIISYREQSGSFNTIDDIKNVSGIGEALFQKIKDKITV